MPKYRVSLAFSRLTDAALIIYALNVIEKMTGNPAYPTPLVALVALANAQATFADAVAAALNGDRQMVAVKNVARQALEALLRQQASYVQGLAGADLPMLLSSGYGSTSTNRSQIALPKPVILRINNPLSGHLGLCVAVVLTAHAYEVRYRAGEGAWQSGGVFTYSRPIFIAALTPGTLYTVQVRAIGGSTGYSDWSDPVSHMAM